MPEDTRRIKVMLVDENATARDELAGQLARNTDFEVISEVATAAQAFMQAYLTEPDVILLATREWDRAPVRAVRDLLLAHERATVCLLVYRQAESELDKVLLPAIWAGANGYLVRTEPLEPLHSAIRRLTTAKVVIRPELAKRLLNVYERHVAGVGIEMPGRSLTNWGRWFLEWIAGGQSSDEIARSLGIDQDMVDAYLLTALDKVRVLVPEPPDDDDLLSSGDRAPRRGPGGRGHLVAANPLSPDDDEERLALMPRYVRAYPGDWPRV